MTTTTRENTHLFIRSPRGTMLPVVSVTCTLCGELVNVLAPQDEWWCCRVGGDSANGYEVGHNNCAPALARTQELEKFVPTASNVIEMSVFRARKRHAD